MISRGDDTGVRGILEKPCPSNLDVPCPGYFQVRYSLHRPNDDVPVVIGEGRRQDVSMPVPSIRRQGPPQIPPLFARDRAAGRDLSPPQVDIDQAGSSFDRRPSFGPATPCLDKQGSASAKGRAKEEEYSGTDPLGGIHRESLAPVRRAPALDVE